MEDIKDIIGRNIRILRKQKGYTLKSLSKQIGISHQQLSRIENGMGTGTSTLERVAVVLDVDVSTLMEKPETTLKKLVPPTKNYVSDQLCNQMYASLYENVIKVANDIAIEKYMDEVFETLITDVDRIYNFMCYHAGTKENYEFTKLELLEFSRKLFLEFFDHAKRISKDDVEEDDNYYEEEWNDIND